MNYTIYTKSSSHVRQKSCDPAVEKAEPGGEGKRGPCRGDDVEV